MAVARVWVVVCDECEGESDTFHKLEECEEEEELWKKESGEEGILCGRCRNPEHRKKLDRQIRNKILAQKKGEKSV